VQAPHPFHDVVVVAGITALILKAATPTSYAQQCVASSSPPTLPRNLSSNPKKERKKIKNKKLKKMKQ